MKVNIFGLGYVGCVSAACLADSGFSITGIDVDEIKTGAINRGESAIVEPGISELLKKGVSSGRLKAGTAVEPDADISIVCVGTPSHDNGSLYLGYIERVSRQIGEYLKGFKSYHVVNIRSTVLPGTIETLIIPKIEEFSGKKAGKDFGVCMNPEFMREGTSVADYYDPPFTIIGQLDSRSGDVISRLYEGIDAPIRRTTIRAAEMIKYSCNAFHALKVTFANEIGNVCKKVGVNSHEVMDIFCMDRKLNISPYYLKPGFAFGGSCLPKDVRALTYKARSVNLELPLLTSILPSNKQQIDIAYKMIAATKKKKIGIFGLSFKPDTDDLRESPMVELAEKLIGKGFHVTIFDREVSLARIFGANKQYIDQVIPHISSHIEEQVEDFVGKSEVVVFAKKSKVSAEVMKRISDGVIVIDLARVLDTVPKKDARYHGICW